MGIRSGLSTTTGYSNTYIGSYAGYSNITGNGNIFVGSNAGRYETGSNKLFIDNQARSNENDGRSKAMMYGVFNSLPDYQELTINANVGIGTLSPDQKLVVYNGSTTGKYTTTGWTHSSDIRLKSDISSLTNVLDEVLRLEGISFVFTNDDSGKRQIGFIAQDVEKIFPEFVVTDEAGFKSIAYGQISAVLVEAIRELQDIIEEKEQRIRSLEERLDTIEALLELNIPR